MVVSATSQLHSVLVAVNEEPVKLTGEAGDKILVLPHGGRILGLYSADSEENFLWTHPALASERSAKEHFRSAAWRNSGGDRTWLAPEIDFFYPEYPDIAIYFQPRQLDPGNYQVTVTQSGVSLENQLSVRSFRSDWEASLRIKKSVSPLRNPLQEAGKAPESEIEFAGYQLHSSLQIEEATSEKAKIGLWHLLQLPGGGEMLIPVLERAVPTVYFGDIPTGDLRVDDRCIRYRMTAAGEQKIGVTASAVTGRTAYVRGDGEQLTLVVRNFTVNPSGAYVDVPLHSPGDGSHAFQACNVNTSRLGVFAEMEYHVPAIGGPGGPLNSDDISQVWAFRGRPEPIRAAARQLLGVQL